MSENIFNLALQCLQQQDVSKKLELTNNLKELWDNSNNLLNLNKSDKIIQLPSYGRPDNLELVQPRELPRRRLGTPQGKAALLHAICHIEFNAINLALDAIYRFQDMPKDYYADWIQIAFEEAKHFKLLNDYLNELGYNYGDFVAHNGLWELAVDTDYDVLVRMALVPRIMEARGLDVTPGIIVKFQNINDLKAVEILNIILKEELGHVAVGNKWFHYLCNLRNLDPNILFKELITKHIRGQIKPPFSRENRLASGFTEQELEILESL